MRRLALVLIGFTIFLNFASGLLYIAVPEFSEYPEITGDGLGKYDSQLTSGFTGTMKETVKPSGGVIEDKGGSIWRVFDMLNIGIIAKFQLIMDMFFYGFINYLGLIFNGLLAAPVYEFIFGTFGLLRIVVTVIYVTAAISLWTGRDVTR